MSTSASQCEDPELTQVLVSLYKPNSAKAGDSDSRLTVDECIAPDGELTIGYGSGGGSRQGFRISQDDLDVEVSYLKIFLTTRPVDLSYIAQESPFSTSRKSYLAPEPRVDLWDTLTMAIAATRGLR